jgi:hypothetical protein
LYAVLGIIFVAELPFLYIINRLITQSLRAEKLSSELNVQQVTAYQTENPKYQNFDYPDMEESMIERALEVR